MLFSSFAFGLPVSICSRHHKIARNQGGGSGLFPPERWFPVEAVPQTGGLTFNETGGAGRSLRLLRLSKNHSPKVSEGKKVRKETVRVSFRVQSGRFLNPFAGFQKARQAVEKVRSDFLDSLRLLFLCVGTGYHHAGETGWSRNAVSSEKSRITRSGRSVPSIPASF